MDYIRLDHVHKATSEASSQFDVVFIHGLGGHAIKTWQGRKSTGWAKPFWPRMIGRRFSPNVNVFCVGYPAIKFKRNDRPYENFELIASDIRLKMIEQGIGRRPTGYVVHSLGGLIIKQILKQDEALDERQLGCSYGLSSSVSFVIFVASPHKGSSWANLGKLVPQHADFLSLLAIDEIRLQELLRYYSDYVTRKKVVTLACYETRTLITPFLKRPLPIIVTKDSSHPECDCYFEGLNADHIGIVKLKNSSERLFQLTATTIENAISSNRLNESKEFNAERGLLR